MVENSLVNDMQQVKYVLLKISILCAVMDLEGKLLRLCASLEMSFLQLVLKPKKLQKHTNLIIMGIS